MNFLEQGAKFLLPDNLIYLDILKIFYERTKISNQDFQNKEDIYNFCKKLEKFKEMKKPNFDNYIQTLYKWGNLEKSCNLKNINKYEKFINENQLYRVTKNTIILLEALRKIENNEK